MPLSKDREEVGGKHRLTLMGRPMTIVEVQIQKQMAGVCEQLKCVNCIRYTYPVSQYHGTNEFHSYATYTYADVDHNDGV
jgi:hypothetical protein